MSDGEATKATELNSGSRWQRWEPHVHAPGTVINDQFGGSDPWEDYLRQLETASPAIRAIAVTDYYTTGTYERVVELKAAGRLPGCELVFPNVELRLNFGVPKGGWVNMHLLVSPEDPKHVEEIKRFLARLKFSAHGDSFACTQTELIRLGRLVDGTKTSDAAALEYGATQFKVTFEELQKEFRASDWAQANVLVAVAGSEGDGTSGLRDAASFTQRQEVEKFAHVIFASSAGQRDFWLGRKAGTTGEGLRERYGGLKPCLHGSDAHTQANVGMPDGKRYSWIKGALSFDSLRQACIDPAGRAYVGSEPPIGLAASQVIQTVEIRSAPWANTPRLAFNPGLVAIIGARGSGKTALADMIAAGSDAYTEDLKTSSFLKRARPKLGGAKVSLTWEGGIEIERPLDGTGQVSGTHYSRVRYLSQQFVDNLCSADGMTDDLMSEIERVIFDAHPLLDREGTADFSALLANKTTRHRLGRARDEEAIATLSDGIGIELDKSKQVAGLASQIVQKEAQIKAYEADRSKLVTSGSETRVARLGELTLAAEKARANIRSFSAQEQSVLALQDDVASFRRHRAPETLRQAKASFKNAGLKEEEWVPFLLNYTGDVDAQLTAKVMAAQEGSKSWKGVTPAPHADTSKTYLIQGADLDRQPLAVLETEINRLNGLVSVDAQTAAQYTAISGRIVTETATLESLKERLTDCEGAADRRKELNSQREAAYVRVFDAILGEQAVLRELYAPLMARLDAAEGTLNKLSFSVSRIADTEQWAADGEALLDLRKSGTLRGRGSLKEQADAILKGAWERGDQVAISAAMAAFREAHVGELLELATVAKSDLANYRAWTRKFAKWLYGTDHITIRYSIDYDGVDIRKLSPGTRGIVLLLLYLALDDADDRPLVIDQPEENLDPKSIFDELVGLFIAAKSKRQVIMVTHNANLVINTDADQIIIAHAGNHEGDELPPITYLSGGLEDAAIRKAVCEILEGGEPAFQERARRLRVRLSR